MQCTWILHVSSFPLTQLAAVGHHEERCECHATATPRAIHIHTACLPPDDRFLDKITTRSLTNQPTTVACCVCRANVHLLGLSVHMVHLAFYTRVVGLKFHELAINRTHDIELKREEVRICWNKLWRLYYIYLGFVWHGGITVVNFGPTGDFFFKYRIGICEYFLKSIKSAAVFVRTPPTRNS